MCFVLRCVVRIILGMILVYRRADAIARCKSKRHQWTERASGRSVGRSPVEAVLFSFVAGELLSILLYAVVPVDRSIRPGCRPWHSITSIVASSLSRMRRARISVFSGSMSKTHCHRCSCEWDSKLSLSAPTRRTPLLSGWFYNSQSIPSARKAAS